MATTELELKRWEKSLDTFVEKRRPPIHIRTEVDLCSRVSGQSVEIFERRADWKDKRVVIEMPIAKATFVRSRNSWRVYWMRSDLKWHVYEPKPIVNSIEEFLNIVDADEHSCFFG